MNSNVYKSLIGILSGILFIASVSYMQAAFTLPYSHPPTYNVDPPINLSQDYQFMTGGLEADAIGVTYGISLGGSNRTAAQGFASLAIDTASCHLEVKRVDLNSGSRTFALDNGVSLSQYPVCDDYLTAQAKLDGWASTGQDNCFGVPGYACGSANNPSTCIYSRFKCNGIDTSPSLVATSTYAGGTISLPINSTSTYPL